MLEIAQSREDIFSRFQNATFCGDVEEKIKILAETGQLYLAYYTALVHGYGSLAKKIKETLTDFPTSRKFGV